MNKFKFVSSFSKVSDILDAVSMIMRILVLIMVIIQGVTLFKNTENVVRK